jgi:hypothetical protein
MNEVFEMGRMENDLIALLSDVIRFQGSFKPTISALIRNGIVETIWITKNAN